MIDPEIDQYRKDVTTKYIDRYYITLDKAEDTDKLYDDIIEYEYLDDSKLWKKIIFPLDIIEGYQFLKYIAMFGEPRYTFLTHHPPMFQINLVPQYTYVAIPPKINCGFVWSTSDYPYEPLPIEKVRLEPLVAILKETEKITFLKVKDVVSTEKVGNVIIKRTEHKRVTDLDKLRQVINREFSFLKFELTEVGFIRIFNGEKAELNNKDHAILL